MKAVALLMALGLLSACATPTPYQPFRAYGAGRIHGGYFEERLGPNRFLIRFHGNSMTPRGRVEQALLYRAAELSLLNGFDHFVLTDPSTTKNVRIVAEKDPRPGQSVVYGNGQPQWRYYQRGLGWRDGPIPSDPITIRRLEAFEATAEIKLENAPVDAGALDAREVITKLGPAVHGKPR